MPTVAEVVQTVLLSVGLSILYLRCVQLVEEGVAVAVVVGLSILYLRCRLLARDFLQLADYLSILYLRCRRLRRGLMCGTMQTLSILYLRCAARTPRAGGCPATSFNSLFEMHSIKCRHEMNKNRRRLSILYLRC